jgi:anti-sigma regulatory factor (Ser/Thr protein kinase)
VRDLGDDQIVTCIYAVYDPGERRLTYANAGHLPPLLRVPGQATRTLALAAEPPLGAGRPVSRGGTVQLPPGAVLALYTDGLVESRTRDIDEGVTMLARCLDRLETVDDEAPRKLVRDLLPDGPDDDVAILLAQVEVPHSAQSIVIDVRPDGQAVSEVRERVAEILSGWAVPEGTIDDVVLLASELTTNAVVYGRSPIEVRVRRTARHVVLETYDSATFLPRRMRPTPEDEHGRGLQLVALLAERWGTRPTETGKAVWCVIPLVPGDDLIDPSGFAPALT